MKKLLVVIVLLVCLGQGCSNAQKIAMDKNVPGTTNQQHLKENNGAVNVKFTADELKNIRTTKCV